MSELKTTPLTATHQSLGARMVPFGGWNMPVTYTKLIQEHHAVRKAVGLFDICHMGEIFVEGPQAEDFIQYITTNDITKIGDGQCQYAICCYEDGGVVDDVISYRFNPQKYLVVVNASNTDKDFEWFQKNNKFDCVITNQSADYFQLALQGPQADACLKKAFGFDASGIKNFNFVETTLGATPVILSRTGYTGEDGFEIYGPLAQAKNVWDALLAQGAVPIGLGARDTLRLESAMSLYGHEINENINPLEARLSWTVKLDKGDFLGKEALVKIKENGVDRKLVGIEMIEAGIPRENYELYTGDQKIGWVTSGTFSPTLEKSIALCLVDKNYSSLGQEFDVAIRKKRTRARVVALPFYRREK